MPNSKLAEKIDSVLRETVSGQPGVAGAVAMATDRDGIIYSGAAGKRVLGEDAAMTTDTVLALFSTTKALGGTAALALVEDGLLDLDAPARDYVPEIATLQVLEGFDDDGAPKMRPPKRDITTRHLLLHTAGFAYDTFNATYRRLIEKHGLLSPIVATKQALMSPLLFDPGDNWEYGINVDWAGYIVARIAGKPLGEVMRERIFEPLGMTSTAFVMTPDMRKRLAPIHHRGADGNLTPDRDFALPQPPEIDMAGHGLYGTVEDYIRFIRMWLNDGNGPHGRVLRPETVEMASRNGIGDMRIRGLPAVDPALTNYAEFFPGMPKSWALTFMVNEEDAPTGRPAGSLGWAGLANLYFWIDRASGVGGFWATQILPFADATSLDSFYRFETAVYDHRP